MASLAAEQFKSAFLKSVSYCSYQLLASTRWFQMERWRRFYGQVCFQQASKHPRLGFLLRQRQAKSAPFTLLRRTYGSVAHLDASIGDRSDQHDHARCRHSCRPGTVRQARRSRRRSHAIPRPLCTALATAARAF
jgi:hypothetical protein